jgi:chorismate mutase/prephenate dehydratase
MTRDEATRVLAERRTVIDEIDLALVELLNRRTRAVEDIGSAKEASGLPVYEPKREDDVYKNVLSHNQGPLPPEALRRIFERIMDEMRSLQKMRREEKGAS